MSTRDSQPRTAEASHVPEPDWFATLPGFPSVTVTQLYTSTEAMVSIEYRGTAEDLVASGVATADMLSINARKGKRHKRIDVDGDRFGLTRIWRSTRIDTGEECPPYRYFYLRRSKLLTLIDRLPGARDAIAARERYEEWREAQSAAQVAILATPHLRLVVDNSRVHWRAPIARNPKPAAHVLMSGCANELTEQIGQLERAVQNARIRGSRMVVAEEDSARISEAQS